MNGNKKYDLNPFSEHLNEWIEGFKFSQVPGEFSVRRDKPTPSLYAVCDLVFILSGIDMLEEYFDSNSLETKKAWISVIQSYQRPKSGWFKEGLMNYGGHFKEHSTAFAVSALQLLGAKPKHDFKIAKKLNTKKKVEKWLKKSPEWGLLYWSGSHRGGGVGSIFAALGPEHYPHEKFFDWYFDWLDRKADPEVGFWRIGWIHKLLRNRLTKNELGGAVHYYWIYEYLGRPWPYPEKIIDSTLKLQNQKGTWHHEFSYCIDLDAIHALTRCLKQTKGYREEDVKAALEKYCDYAIPFFNDKEFIFNNYTSAHKLTGYVSAIAELYKFMPDMFEVPKPMVQTLDITPWI